MEGKKEGNLADAQRKVTLIFLVLGVASLTAFNATLSELFFFQHFLKNHNPGEIFTSINNGLNLSILILFQIFGNFISYTKQLILFQLLGFISLVSLPLIVIYLEETVSYYVVCVFFGFIGVGNALANSSLFGVAAYFPVNNIVQLGVGQGIAGVLSNVLNFVILFCFGSDSEQNLIKSAYIYFFVSAGILLFSIFLTFKLFKNEFFIAIASKAGIVKGVDEREDEDTEKLQLVNDEPSSKEEEKLIISEFLGKIGLCAIMMFLLFFVTFLIFPGGVLKPELFNLPAGIKVNTILLTFNIFDTIGRKLADMFELKTSYLSITTILRIGLVGSTYYTAYANEVGNVNKYFVYALTLINPALLALTNGYGASLAFALAPTFVKKSWKGRAGQSMSLFLCIGMFIGSISSLKFLSLLNFKK